MTRILSRLGLAFHRRHDAGQNFVILVISFAFSVLATRIYLDVANYPKLGVNGIHVAHLLWGGLLLLIGATVAIIYRGKLNLQVAAVLIGLGWGLFIDEIGKFVTANNDYFFRPAAPIIYLCFLLFCLIAVYFRRKRKPSVEERIFSVLEGMEEVVGSDLQEDEKEYMLGQLDTVIHAKHPANQNYLELAKALRKIVKSSQVRAAKDSIIPKSVLRIYQQIKYRFLALVESPAALVILGVITLVRAISAFFDALSWLNLILAQNSDLQLINTLQIFPDLNSRTELILFLVNIVIKICVGIIILLGLASLKLHRKLAVRSIVLGLILSVAFSDIFDFYFNQFVAAVSTCFDIALLYAWQYFLVNRPSKTLKMVTKTSIV